ncbi:MAG: hypothetical protein ACRDZR_13625 [Acidimicrobiales bacterium]
MPSGQDTGWPEEGDRGGASFRERWSRRILKPVDPSAPHAPVADPLTVEELEHDHRYLNDRERAIGLLAGPVAALISFLVIHADITNDPVQHLKNGTVNPKYTPVSTYHELLLVLLVLSVLTLAMAWFRKRLFLGMVLALYGLALFNLHWWGFGVPFVLVGAWYLVRAYRAQRALKEATGGASGAPGADGSSPRPNKRYTPPTARPKRSTTAKRDPEGEQKAG